jgi:HK97 family phage prohead protease
MKGVDYGLEMKFARLGSDVRVSDGTTIEGYASMFGIVDQGGDMVVKGAYSRSLSELRDAGRRVKMLWQHDPAEPIGIWDEVREDEKGLYVKGRILVEVERGREAAALVAGGAIDGLSIGYRTVTAERDGKGRRLLRDLDLWEVSLVTFPMLPDARVGSKTGSPDMDEVAQVIAEATNVLAAMKWTTAHG